MEQYGLVTENKGETALINLQRHLVCEKCGRCGLLSGSNKREVIVEALNPINAKKGQRVLLESDDSQIILLAFMLYMVPIFALVAGIVVWLTLVSPYFGLDGRQELPAVSAGFALMALVYFFIRKWDKRVKDNPRYKPVITGFIEDKPTECSEPE